MMDRSNRDVSDLLVLLNPLSDFDVNYKYVERFYLDGGL